jgi:hypothetical protein
METLVSGYEAISPTGEARSLEAPIDKAVEIDGLTASVQQEFILEVVEGVKSLGEIDIEKFVYEGASGKQGIARMARSVETYSVSEIVESVKLMCISAQADEPEENIEELPW